MEPWLIWQKINYIDYRWSSFRSFYFGECEPIEVDKDWWWEGDVQKLARASAEWTAEIEREKNAK